MFRKNLTGLVVDVLEHAHLINGLYR